VVRVTVTVLLVSVVVNTDGVVPVKNTVIFLPVNSTMVCVGTRVPQHQNTRMFQDVVVVATVNVQKDSVVVNTVGVVLPVASVLPASVNLYMVPVPAPSLPLIIMLFVMMVVVVKVSVDVLSEPVVVNTVGVVPVTFSAVKKKVVNQSMVPVKNKNIKNWNGESFVFLKKKKKYNIKNIYILYLDKTFIFKKQMKRLKKKKK